MSMERLIRGYREFRKTRWREERANYLRLAKRGQRPEYLLIACSDSRSDPATVFNGHPGEFFVVRNVAAVVPPYEANAGYYGTRAAIAYAVLALNVRNVVVMGHAQCGGVAAAIDPSHADKIPFLQQWVELLKPAVEKAGHEHNGHQHERTERAAVALSVERLKQYPFIAERIKSGALHVDGLRFGIADGTLELLDQDSGAFELVEKPPFAWLFGTRRAA
jgi:carbonic anhydrase